MKIKVIAIYLWCVTACFAFTPALTSFNTGQVGPLLDSRSDFAKYNTACRTVENMLVLPQGPVERRPGTKYIATTKYTTPVTLIPFEYSTTDSYVLELGKQYARVYRNSAPILNGSSPYEIVTPFYIGDLNDIQYSQAANAMYLVDGNNPPQKLRRLEHNSWTIAPVNFTTGPFMETNTGTTTITPTGSITTVGATITLTASASIFQEKHEGSLWQIDQERSQSVYKSSISSDTSTDPFPSVAFTGGYSFTTGGTWSATVTLERSTDSGSTWTAALAPLNSQNFNNPAEVELEGAIYRVTMEDRATGTCKYTFIITDQYNHGIVKIADYTSGTSVTATVIKPLVDTTATTKWAEGYWSNYRGWPKTVEFHQQRLIFGGSNSFPQTIWFGKANPNDYENFTAGTLDTDAFTMALPGQNPIQWLLSQDYLFLGTSGSAGKYGDQGKAITPTSPNYREQSKSGSSNLKAVLAGDAILYVERGGRKVREFLYSLQQDKYLSPDLTILANNIAESGIIDIAFQARPEPTLWCVLADGNMATLSYQRDQEVIGWAKQHTDGAFESVTVIPGISEDEVWTSVRRTIGGSEVVYIEQFQPRRWGADPNNCWFVDSGLSYNGTANDTFNGLEHLAGKTVSVFADGVAFPNVIVSSSGTAVIADTAKMVTIGLPFTSKFETLPLFIDPQDKSMNKKITSIDFDFYQTGACSYGNGTQNPLTEINFYDDSPVHSKQGLYTSTVALKRCSFPYGSMKKQTVYAETSKPLPLTIRAIVPNYTITP